MQKVIGRWFFFASLTGRYTSSPESVMDGDLNRLRVVNDAARFVAALDELIGNQLTGDFWTTTLPAALNSSSARNPELFAYVAAQNRLNAPVLFSHKKLSELLDPALKTKKKSLERHHLFPRAWLEREGEEDRKIINQMANYALLEWPDNIDISAAIRHRRTMCRKSAPVSAPRNGSACRNFTPCPKAGSRWPMPIFWWRAAS